jgi:cellulose synthase/poly-beta-1,6-N-acetylglucosamine synthase-like glycosyltransferase
LNLWVEAGLGWADDVYVDGRSELASSELPTIDVLLPAYEEGPVISEAITSIRTADYPQQLISVVVLVEPDDDDTHQELDRLARRSPFADIDTPGGLFTRLTVPASYPGEPNKPRALNFGFQESYSDIVGILDAEDVADRKLFQLVAGGIEGLGYDYVQGRLDMANEDDGWLNTLFRGEYGYWYRLHIPAYYHAGYPIPLGGTTNFYRRSVLEEISTIRKERFGARWSPDEDIWLSAGGQTGPIPWDPLNVTEDFELGLLLWLEDYDLGLLDVDTLEESPTSLDAWIRQRTRWQKGKVFSLLQFLRHPPDDYRDRFHVIFQSAVPHLGPVNITGVVLLSMIAVQADLRFSPLVFLLLLTGLLMTGQFMLIQAIGYWMATDATLRIRVVRTAINALTLPVYWILLWGADLRALWQVYRGSTVWEKTPHSGKHLSDD